jgi:hypothetical protein
MTRNKHRMKVTHRHDEGKHHHKPVGTAVVEADETATDRMNREDRIDGDMTANRDPDIGAAARDGDTDPVTGDIYDVDDDDDSDIE